MCDYSAVAGLITTALVALTAAAILIAAAVVANLTFFGAPGAVPVAIAAAVLCGTASVAIFTAMGLGHAFIDCINANFGSACPAAVSGFDIYLGLLGGLMALETGIIIVAVATSGIPWAGSGGLVAWAALIGSESVLLGLLGSAYNDLQTCVNGLTRMPTIPGWVFIFLGIALVVTLLVSVFIGLRGGARFGTPLPIDHFTGPPTGTP
jgi:hypothetical protein